MEWRILFRLFFLGCIAIIFWLFSRSLHSNYNATERRIFIPNIVRYILGAPGLDGKYNLAGIYGQTITILMVIAFTLLNFGKLTRHDSIVIIAAGITLVMVFMELVALFQKK
jgi:hypothetical protein